MSLKIYNGLLIDIRIFKPEQTTPHVDPETGGKRDILKKWCVPPILTYPTGGGCLKATSKTVPYLERVRKEIPLTSTVYAYADELPEGYDFYIVYPAYYEARAQLRKSTAKLIMPFIPVYRFGTTDRLEGFLNFTNSPNKAFDFSQDNYHYNQNFKTS
jgi:hypothetical protein